ncbi:MAG TPA: AbrB/MazE/SpoVT family DNA-binding domain-containing protein [Nitrospirae bacterium]|nr:AbrB/MazE/SpoVT family DNA-binding domain-containing protein [Nitrospirota bacterium]
MSTSLITSKGQTTIPKKIREYLNLQPGDRVDFVVDEDGKVILQPATVDVRELEGILYRADRKTVPLKEMKKAVRNRFKRKQV